MKYTGLLQRLARFVMPSYAVMAFVYLGFVLWLPVSQSALDSYQLTNSAYRVILLAIAIPTLVVWFTAFLGYSKLLDYAAAIKSAKEGRHFIKLAEGAAWLAWSLPVPTLIGLILNAVASHISGFHATSIILSNYINLILPLIAFTIISTATRGLFVQSKLNYNIISSRVITLFFVVTGVLFCYLTFRRFDLSSLSSTHNPYFLPIWLMVLTVTVPYLYIWFVGLLGAYELTIYSRNTQGVIYRQALTYLAFGLAAVIFSSIAQQYLNSVQPRTGHLVIDYRIIANLIFRILGGVGFVVMALGAIRLKKIEEV